MISAFLNSQRNVVNLSFPEKIWNFDLRGDLPDAEDAADREIGRDITAAFDQRTEINK